MAFAINAVTPPSIQTYLEHPSVKGIQFNEEKKGFMTADGTVYRGLHSMLRFYHYPTYVHSSRTKRTQKKGSSKAIGARVDQQLFQYVASQYKKRPKHKMAAAILVHLKQRNQIIVAAQLPVYIDKLKCITQADIVAMDVTTGKLWLYEVKTGYPTGGHRKKGTLKGKGLSRVPNTVYNHWELQRYYTMQGMHACGLPIEYSAVLHTYIDKKAVVVNTRAIPKWVGKYLTK